MTFSSRPESLNVPEYQRIDTYKGRLGTLAVRLAPSDMLPYRQEQGVIYRNVELNRQSAGEFNLKYDYDEHKITIDNIYLGPTYRGRGLGSALYRAALLLALPDGGQPRSNGFVLESKGSLDDANTVWQSFVERGIAEEVSKSRRHYIMR